MVNLFLQAPPSAEDEVMKARMERAELAIQRQRERQAKEKAEKEKAEEEANSMTEDGGGKVWRLMLKESNILLAKWRRYGDFH